MIINEDFLRTAQNAFNPYSLFSGTEHTAPFLYSLVRMTRPKAVVEYGSGYTTLFLLAALAENTADMKEEATLLWDKTKGLGDLRKMDLSSVGLNISEWYGKGAKAVGADPAYYLNMHTPHLYSFEQQGGDQEYTQRMKDTVEALHLTDWFTYLKGRRFSIDALPPEALPIDLAWNDDHYYMEFFETLWPSLNPKGGIMVFHNTVARRYCWDAIKWMKEQRSFANDLEIVTLPEIHKIDQSGCTILRRTTEYQPPCLTRYPEEIFRNAMKFMENASYSDFHSSEKTQPR